MTASDISSATCTVNPGSVVLTFDSSSTSVTSTPQFSAGSYTTSVQLMATTTGSNSANTDPAHSGTQTWDDTDQTVTITTSDQTSSHTMTNSGVGHRVHEIMY